MIKLFVLIMALICVTFASADESLIVYLPFDNGTGDDVTDNGNNGEYIGDVKKADGKFNCHATIS